MRAPLVALFAVTLSGCYGVGWNRTDVAPPATPVPTGAFEQYCIYYGSSDIEEVNAFLHQQATRGWKLVGVTGQHGTIDCFVADTAPAQTPSATPEARL